MPAPGRAKPAYRHWFARKSCPASPARRKLGETSVSLPWRVGLLANARAMVAQISPYSPTGVQAKRPVGPVSVMTVASRNHKSLEAVVMSRNTPTVKPT